MVWYGMMWCGVLYGGVWCGMVWYVVVWYDVVWCGTVYCGMVWYGMMWYGVVCYDVYIVCWPHFGMMMKWKTSPERVEIPLVTSKVKVSLVCNARCHKTIKKFQLICKKNICRYMHSECKTPSYNRNKIVRRSVSMTRSDHPP